MEKFFKSYMLDVDLKKVELLIVEEELCLVCKVFVVEKEEVEILKLVVEFWEVRLWYLEVVIMVREEELEL